MKNLSKSEKLLLGILLFMIVGYVYYQYIITPVSIKTKAVQSSVDSYQQQMLQVKLMEASNKKMTADESALKEKYEKYIKVMPKSDMNAEIIREVNKLAVDSKVTLTTFTLGGGAEYNPQPAAADSAQKTETTAAVKIMAVPVSIGINGDYNSFTAFINGLESGGRLTSITNVNVAKQGNDASGDKLTITLNASMLYVQDGTNSENKYDFNNGNYSKTNPFK